ncbi:hypothetical protein [Streptomyces sp. NPDC054863]
MPPTASGSATNGQTAIHGAAARRDPTSHAVVARREAAFHAVVARHEATFPGAAAHREAARSAPRNPAAIHHLASPSTANGPSPNSTRGNPKTAIPGRYGLKSAVTTGSATYGLPAAISNSADRSTTRTSSCACPVSTSAVSGSATAPTSATTTGFSRTPDTARGRTAAHPAAPYPSAAVSPHTRCGPSPETRPKSRQSAPHPTQPAHARRALLAPNSPCRTRRSPSTTAVASLMRPRCGAGRRRRVTPWCQPPGHPVA